MARMWSQGADYAWLPPMSMVPYGIGGYTAGTTAVVHDTVVARSVGGTSFKCVGGTTATSYWNSYGIAVAEVYSRVWFYVDTLPTSTARIYTHHGTTNHTYAQLTSAGMIEFICANASNVPSTIGTSSTAIAVNTWNCIQIHHRHVTGDHSRSMWLNDKLLGTTTTAAALQTTTVLAGWITAPGTTATIWVDDIAENNVAGTYEKTRPRMDGRVVRFPISRVISNDSWLTCENTSTDADLIAGVDTYPPAGHPEATNHTTSHQIRCTVAGSGGSPRYIEFECHSLGRVGVGGNIYLEPGAGTYSAFGNTAARTRIAQGFYMTGTLELPRLWLRKVGSPADTITLSLLADSSGSPSATVLQSTTYSGAALSTSVAAIDFADFPNHPLTPKTKYWLELKRSGANDASNYYEVETCASGLYYDGGEALYNASWGAPTLTTAWHIKLYSTEGAAIINSMIVLPIHGEAVATGTKTGTYSLSNPTIADTTFTAGDDQGAADTFQSGSTYTWKYPWSTSSSTVFTNNLVIPNAALAPRPKIGKTDSGTRAVLVCMLGVIGEWQAVEGEWLQFTKIVGGATWYGKRPARITSVIRDDDSELLVDAGDWIMMPSLPSEDTAYPAATVSVTDATLRTDYTLVGPAG